MATFLDISLLPAFSDIFTLLLVFIITFAILEFTKLFGENKGIHSIIALCFAMLLLMSGSLMQIVKNITPWFVILLIFIMFLILSFRWMGVPEASINATMSKWGIAHYFLLAVAIIIIIAGIGSVYGNQLLPVTEGGNVSSNQFSSNVGATLFNPKILGMVLIFMVGTFTIMLLAGGPMVKK